MSRLFRGSRLHGCLVATEEFRCAPGPMGWRDFSELETTDPSPHHETLDFAFAGRRSGDRGGRGSQPQWDFPWFQMFDAPSRGGSA
jgi:hypothetical protein